jgi:hypothetical protein
MDDFTLVLLWHIHKWCMEKKKQLLNHVLGKNILHEWELWSLIVNYITISFSAHSHMVSHLMTPFYNV